MSEHRKRFTEEFKKQTVKYVQEQTKSIADICEELGIAKSTVHQWMNQFRQFENESVNLPEKIRQLEAQNKSKDRELADLREEMAILKKALHIFSKERN
ncbi:transposase IS3/IS911 family protein [Paenibacillus curdlanolyticus YK9]|uniref:Transposase IS3/IS911 family protein n=1 Tax=Paenibacillus curdlanolyticus YK9 TaxID=717606 RepID=E0IAB3_9BACL|nr:transposase [Paenibacillus curdlanolyticus]EFM09395.1 transposase IS3/IS911 family protein [Paenibacillus curdlanolyticus YK9]EFM09430.1 transposase IS3/IS911 family protein [Paenibacillus curdlanolyticus YK9]EFM10478.1 transposase IS3/IS911 family protein [Paenibacillus curdlanolyticus YK9]EFM10690.1 transposase IS3/IS911 family protein [Paenibacillus curdlanolyticus YK9]